MKYQFTMSITVEGVPYKAGDVIEKSDILPGCFDSCFRQKKLVPYEEAPEPAPAKAKAEKDPAPEPVKEPSKAGRK